MDARFGLYPHFYVSRKSLLFPLIEKYSGKSMKGATHGEAIQLYLDLLKTNAAFKSEVDALILQQNFKEPVDLPTAIGNAFKKLWDLI
jgi:hypothetical protein